MGYGLFCSEPIKCNILCSNNVVKYISYQMFMSHTIIKILSINIPPLNTKIVILSYYLLTINRSTNQSGWLLTANISIVRMLDK